jgi:hypothetical protein
MSAFTITPEAIAATPVLEIVISPLIALSTGRFPLEPTHSFPESSGVGGSTPAPLFGVKYREPWIVQVPPVIVARS